MNVTLPLHVVHGDSEVRAENSLASFLFSDSQPTEPTRGLEIDLSLSALASSAQVETWLSPRAARLSEMHGFRVAQTSEWWLGTTSVPAPDVFKSTRDAYSRLAAVLRDSGVHLVRMWHSIPDILGPSEFGDRYKAFSAARSSHVQAATYNQRAAYYCAATAVGNHSDRQVMTFLASCKPGTHIENTRQWPSHTYPEQYGAEPPFFARATTASPSGETTTFVSGTASIVGHKTRHTNDPRRQTLEALTNLETVLAGQTPQALRVYVTSPSHLPAIQSAFMESTWDQIPRIELHADLCRPDLLVEIEAIACAYLQRAAVK